MKKILFIDDEESQRDVIERVLARMGYTTTLAASAQSALDILRKEHFPLVITDLNMPGMNGALMCRQIREFDREAIIYALSGFVDAYDVQNLEKVGFDGYIRKPVSRKVLKHAVESAFEKLKQTGYAHGLENVLDAKKTDTTQNEQLLGIALPGEDCRWFCRKRLS